MTAVTVAVLALGLVALAIAVWNAVAWPGIGAPGEPRPGEVAVLVPARDEAANIADCLESVLAQGPTVAQVIVYDDRSADDTAAIVREYASRDARVRLVGGRELPAGWCGKNFACARLAAESAAPWLLFLDADARLGPRAVDRLLGEARRRDVTLLSPWPDLEMRTFWERVAMPMLDVMTFSLYPGPLSLVREDVSLGLAHGACMLARRDRYETIGTHESVRAAILEDQQLARRWRLLGERGLCLPSNGTVSVRMYRSLPEIAAGFSKNFYPAFERAASFWLFLLHHAAVFALPLVLAAIAPTPLAVAAVLVVAAIRVVLAVRFRHSWWSVPAHPIGEAVLIAIAVRSWWQCRRGCVVWKGRRYDVGRGGAA